MIPELRQTADLLYFAAKNHTMNFLVTAGPTFEPLDQVRRLTNFSTGRLGVELAAYMADRGHRVTLLLSEQATFHKAMRGVEVVPFTTGASLRDALEEQSKLAVEAVFHAAAVSDFKFGQVWRRDEQGELIPVQGSKISTRQGPLMAELVPTPKLITELREFFPDGWLVGWKYEVDGDRATLVAAAEAQIEECRSSGCVINGPAYGEGFGLVFHGERVIHTDDVRGLCAELLRVLNT